eukprot:11179635-Lingulodinium_polyedra.AAC.1
MHRCIDAPMNRRIDDSMNQSMSERMKQPMIANGTFKLRFKIPHRVAIQDGLRVFDSAMRCGRCMCSTRLRFGGARISVVSGTP